MRAQARGGSGPTRLEPRRAEGEHAAAAAAVSMNHAGLVKIIIVCEYNDHASALN